MQETKPPYNGPPEEDVGVETSRSIGTSRVRWCANPGGQRDLVPCHTSTADVLPRCGEADGEIARMQGTEDIAPEIVETYEVLEPYGHVRINYNKETSEHSLDVVEPHLLPYEEKLLNIIKETMYATLDREWGTLATQDRRRYLRECMENFVRDRGYRMDSLSKGRVEYYLLRDLVGYGCMDVLMHDENIEDISCDGVGVPLFVYHSQYGSIRTGLTFDREEELNSFVVWLGQRAGGQLSVSSPILDGTTPEGHRVQATYSREVTTRGSTFTIRRFRSRPFTPIRLIKNGTASPEMMAYLWLGVENGESMIICGGTASGKTSTLNGIALFIPPQMKIVSIEDTREINLPHLNWAPSAIRPGAGERGPDGRAPGEIDMYDLMRASLRQRPQYLIVGEVRGKEAHAMFQAMATGHTTYSTMHADSVQTMVNRLEGEPINCPRILLTSLRNVIIQAQVKVQGEITRRIRQVIEVVGFEPDTNELISSTVFEWDRPSDCFIYKGHSFLFDRIMELRSLTHEEMLEEFHRRVDVIRYMVYRDIAEHRPIWDIINRYGRDPVGVVEQMRSEMRDGGIDNGT